MPIPRGFNRMWSKRSFTKGKSAQETYQVTGASDINDAIGVVGILEGATHEQDARLVIPLGGISVTQTGPVLYEVQLNYQATQITSAFNNQLNEAADIFPQLSKTSAPVEQDIYGVPIANSAGILFEGIVDEDTSLYFTLAQYESTYDAQKVIAYTYPRPTLNDAPVTIPRLGTFLAGQLKLTAVTVDAAFQAGAASPSRPNVRIIYHLEARGYYELQDKTKVTGFAKRILDRGAQGYYTTPGGTRGIGPIIFGEKDDNGNYAPAGEVNLNGNGTPLEYPKYKVMGDFSLFPDTTHVKNVTTEFTDTGVFLYYIVNKPMPFAGLGWKLG